MTGWEVLYASGRVPSLDTVAEALSAGGASGTDGQPLGCERLVNPASGMPTLECMVGGLGFDIAVSDSWDDTENPDIEHVFGIEMNALPVRQGLSVMPGPNIATIAHAMPVVRAGARVAREICRAGDPLAVIWRPIGSAMGTRYFCDIADSWFAGGPFPALGLTSLRAAPDGGLHSHGLALFIGQELRLVPAVAEGGVSAYTLGARLIDRLVEGERVRASFSLPVGNGRAMRLSPSPNGRFVIADWE